MHLINLFIGGLPLIIIIYHTICIPFGFKKHSEVLLKQSMSFLFSRFLKSIFKKERNHFLKKDMFFRLRAIMHMFGSKYSFPSSHVMFFTSYFFQDYDTIEILLISGLSYGRVYYKHHTLNDILFGMIFGSLFNVAYDYFKDKLKEFRDRKKTNVIHIGKQTKNN